MRITAGQFRGRRLAVPDVPGLRPTPAMVREALFNILGDIGGQRVLDLFAGSGLMALESLSRGAASVVSVERHRRAIAHMQDTRHAWGLEEGWRIMPVSVERALSELAGSTFDLVFADPPYERGISAKLPTWLADHDIGCDLLVVEESAKVEPAWPGGWTHRQARRYGDTCLHFLEREQS